MSRDHLLRILAFLSVGIAFLHITAIVFYLYWIFWWYDMLVHFLGGVFAALLSLWFLFFSGYVRAKAAPTVFRVFVMALLSVVLLGVLWEVFERLSGQTWSVEGYWLDTGVDMVFDVLGGFFGFLFFRSRYMVHGRGE